MAYDGQGRAVRRRPSRRRRQHQQQIRGPLPRVRNVLVILGLASLTVTFGAVASFGYAYNSFSEELPEINDYQAAELAQTSVVYDRSGEPVDELYGVQNRYVVDRDEVSPYLREAVVAIEDNRFYRHEGLDFEAIGRAMVSNLRTLSVREGGSTITQQLIKNTYIDQELRAVPSFQRKINEAALAWQYEDEHSKEEILNQYLNTVYFGQNAYGAEAAARSYFDKSAEELTVAESAMLAGVINLPGTYAPFAYPESSRKRRDVVLDKMLAQDRISGEQHREAVASDLGVTRGDTEESEADDYFLNAVRQEVIREYGEETLYKGGLDIYTTLDPGLQGQADEAVESIVRPEQGDPSASLVSVEPSTGAVRAMVGGSDFEDIQFNLATQAKRQPGSTFKTFVLAEAIKQGISLDTEYESRFLQIPLPESDEVYEVDNYDNIRRGEIDLRKSIAQSDNTAFVQLALDLGMEKVVDTAEALGIEADLDPYPATAIGGLGEGVSPLEMASAYSTLANGGVHAEPYLVRKVEQPAGGEEKVREHEKKEERVLSGDEAATVTQALKGVVEDGTASYYRDLPAEIGRESAGKTGTTDNFIDAWYVGYIPQLTTSVWVGYPTERRSMVNIRGYEEINGENFPLDIWSTYMQDAVGNYEKQSLAEPSEEFLKGLKEDKVGIPPKEQESYKKEQEKKRRKQERQERREQREQREEKKEEQKETTAQEESTTPNGEANEALRDILQQVEGSTGDASDQNARDPASQPESQQEPSQPGVSPRSGNQPEASPQGAAPQRVPQRAPQQNRNQATPQGTPAR